MDHIGASHYQKVAYILARSKFFFQEHILNQMLFKDVEDLGFKIKFISLKATEIGSILPSLAKARYNND